MYLLFIFLEPLEDKLQKFIFRIFQFKNLLESKPE